MEDMGILIVGIRGGEKLIYIYIYMQPFRQFNKQNK